MDPRIRLWILRRAWNRQMKRKERQHMRLHSTANSFQCLRKLFGDMGSDRLKQPKEVVEDHLKRAVSVARKGEVL